jgi:hypothetical protein
VILWLDRTGQGRIPPWGHASWSVGRKRDAGTLAGPAPDYILDWPKGDWTIIDEEWACIIPGELDTRALVRPVRPDGSVTLQDGTACPAGVVSDARGRSWVVPIISDGPTVVLPRSWGPGGKRIATPLQASLIEMARGMYEAADGQPIPEEVQAEWVSRLIAATNHVPAPAVLPLGLVDDVLVPAALRLAIGDTGATDAPAA